MCISYVSLIYRKRSFGKKWADILAKKFDYVYVCVRNEKDGYICWVSWSSRGPRRKKMKMRRWKTKDRRENTVAHGNEVSLLKCEDWPRSYSQCYILLTLKVRLIELWSSSDRPISLTASLTLSYEQHPHMLFWILTKTFQILSSFFSK